MAEPYPTPEDLGQRPGRDQTDVDAIRTAMGRSKLPATKLPEVVDSYAPPRVREITAAVTGAISKAIDKPPLVVIAEAIIDLRYTIMMQWADELAKHNNGEKPDSYAKLLNDWAHETVNGKPEKAPE